MSFDSPPDRTHSDSMKWQRYAGQDVIPLWVADMDFPAPAPVIDALQARVAHGVFGYATPGAGLEAAVIEHLRRDFDWRVEPEWLVWLPGVVSGLNLACALAGEPGDEVITLTPVYPPFLAAPLLNARRSVQSAMVRREGRWQCDWENFENCLSPRSRLLMLCHPHNPVGRLFDEKELRRFANFAEQHGMLICSDEIHCGLVLDPKRRHIPLASLDEQVARRTITLMAPSKTWNIAGLSTAFAVISDARLRGRFKLAMQGVVPHVNTLGLVAAEAAYRHGEPWRKALLETLRSNARTVEKAVARMPGLRTTHVEATYLAWIDCRELDLADPHRFFEGAGVGLSDGKDFGAPGFVRLNFGCNPALLNEALSRMQAATAKLKPGG